MGNNHSNRSSSSHLNGLSRARSIVRRSKKTSSKSVSSKSALSVHEAFFIAHHKAQQIAALNEGKEFDESNSMSPISPSIEETEKEQIDLRKRLIFVSLMGLYQSWKNVPSTILYSSIFLLPLKREWVYKKEKFIYQHDFERVLDDSHFVKLLKWKDAQGLAFWMKDGIPSNELEKCMTPTTPDFIDCDGYGDCNWINDGDVDVAPFWRYLSYKLSNIYDPMTGNNYNPLQLDYKWWQKRFDSKSNEEESIFNVTTDQIRKELYFLTMKFKAMAELLYQSNKTLNIVTVYTLNYNYNYNNNGDLSNINNASIRSRETSQKSYNSLPDHVLCEMAEDCNITNNNNHNHINNDNYTIDVNTPCDVQELDLNGDITPNPNENNPNNNNGNNNDDNDNNIWWVSTEYDEVMEIHDNDELYDDFEDDEDQQNDNPLLITNGEETNHSIIMMIDRKTI